MFSRENVDVADDLASVTDHVGRNTEENCRWELKMFHMFIAVSW